MATSEITNTGHILMQLSNYFCDCAGWSCAVEQKQGFCQLLQASFNHSTLKYHLPEDVLELC